MVFWSSVSFSCEQIYSVEIEDPTLITSVANKKKATVWCAIRSSSVKNKEKKEKK